MRRVLVWNITKAHLLPVAGPSLFGTEESIPQLYLSTIAGRGAGTEYRYIYDRDEIRTDSERFR